MFDLAAIAVALACFVFVFLLLYVLERVWCRPATRSALRFRCSSLRISCTRFSVGSAS